jgi:5'-3' exonuclease
MTPMRCGDQPTQAIYGFMRSMRPIMDVFRAFEPVVLWDKSSWRHHVFAEYKANRDKPAVMPHEIKSKKLKADLKTQLPFIREGLSLLGVKQLSALNYEADDLAGLLVERYAPQGSRIMMLSADEDWIQLVRSKVAWRDPIKDRNKFVTVGNIMEKQGVPSPRAHLEVKCLMGDLGDNISGVGKIGEKGAKEFINQYGSVAAFLNQCADKTIDITKLHKKFRDFATSDEKQDLFRRNMRLMDLSTAERPAPVNLQLVKGQLDVPAFGTFCEQFLFNSITTKLEDWCAPFGPQEEAIAA